MQQPKWSWSFTSPLAVAVLVLVIVLVALFTTLLLVMGPVGIAAPPALLPFLRLLILALALVTAGMVLLIFNMRLETINQAKLQSELQRLNIELNSQLKGRAAELADERTQSKTILQSMSEGVIVLDQRHIRYVNRALTRLTGYGADELSGKSLDEANGLVITHQLAQLRDTVTGAIEQGGIWQGPYRLQLKDGKQLDVSVIGLPLEGTNGDAGQILMLIRDNSLEKKLQAQKTTFVSNASHELRTPLASLKTRLYLLKKQPDKLEEHLPVMEEMTLHMQTLLEEMLDIGRFERGTVHLDRERGVLQELVGEVVENYQSRANRRSINLSLHLEEPPIKVLVDHKRFAQVVTNLISNAANHVQQDGHIDVSVRLDPSSNGRKIALVEVSDDGVGVSPEMLSQIFQPFSSASQGLVSGTILGLSLAKEIIELHGGEIKAESPAQKGTRFTIRLPALDT